jgi:hypothetical protein
MYPKIGEAMMANLIQIRLMPLAFRVDHGGVEISMSDRDTRNKVAREWAQRYASAFREYIEDNPRETLNIHDEDALIEFLMKVKEYMTVH